MFAIGSSIWINHVLERNQYIKTIRKVRKLIIIIFLYIIPDFLWAQVKYDTILFSNITLNNHKLYTKFNHFQKFVDDTKTGAKVFLFNEAYVPFICFKPPELIYEIYSQNLGFSYAEHKPENIYITYVMPKKNLSLKIKRNNTFIVFPKKNNLLMLKKLFNNSFNSYQNDKKEFRLIVKKGNEYAFCCLVFEGCRFIEMYLINQIYAESFLH